MRWPTFRIFLLAAFGAVVYLKFDTLASSRILHMLGHPKHIQSTLPSGQANTSPAASAVLQWSPDSDAVNITCTANQVENCLRDGAEALGSEPAGSLRALIGKTALQWQLIPTSGFSAHFQKIASASEGTRDMYLRRLEIFTASGPTVLTAEEVGGSTRFCKQSQCLDQIAATPPFSKFQSLDRQVEHPPELELRPLAGKAFHAVLPGRVVEVVSGSQWVKIYHGRNIFSSYGGFSELRSNLHTGSLVNMKTLWDLSGEKSTRWDAYAYGLKGTGYSSIPWPFLIWPSKVRWLFMGADIRMAYLEMRKAGENRFPTEFLEYLYRFVFRASLKGKDFHHVKTGELCAGFQSQVIADFGAMTEQILELWKVRSFGDLGDAVFLLAKYGCFNLIEQDTREEYAAAGPIRFT